MKGRRLNLLALFVELPQTILHADAVLRRIAEILLRLVVFDLQRATGITSSKR